MANPDENMIGSIRDAAVTPTQLLANYRSLELDGFRGVAISCVLIWHYVCGEAQPLPGSALAYIVRLIGFSWVGVDLFFVLSGFLVGGILLDTRNRPGSIAAFLIKRMFRIAPIYLVSLLIFVFAPLAHRGPADAADSGWTWLFGDSMPLWSYALFVQNMAMGLAGHHGANWLGVTWSLALEMQLYLLLALVVGRCPQQWLAAVLATLVVAAVLFRVLLMWRLPVNGGFLAFQLLPTRMDAACVGVLVALALRKPQSLVLLRRSRHLLLMLAAGCLALVVTMSALRQGIGSWGMNLIGHSAMAMAGASIIILLVTHHESPVHRICRQRPLASLGVISYGTYLLHQPVAGVLHHFLLGQAPRISNTFDACVTAASLVVTLALATMSWRLLEQPCIESGRSIAANWQQRYLRLNG